MQLLRQENTTLGKAGFCSTDCKQKTYKAESSICPTQTTGSAFLDFLIQMGEESEREAAAERAMQILELFDN